MTSGRKEAFIHSSSNSKFKERNDAIFGGLSGLEERYDKEVPKDDPFAENYTRQREKPRRPKKVPDHVLHPEKWTKYSLEEDGTRSVSSGKTGDALNKEIAMNFIAELRSRRATAVGRLVDEKMEIGEEELPNDHTGLKRKRDKLDEDEDTVKDQAMRDTNTIIDSSTTLIMKTYEVGQKQPRKPNFKSNVKGEVTAKELCLSHLSEGSAEIEEISKEAYRIDEKKTKFSTVRKAKRNLRKCNDYDD